MVAGRDYSNARGTDHDTADRRRYTADARQAGAKWCGCGRGYKRGGDGADRDVCVWCADEMRGSDG